MLLWNWFDSGCEKVLNNVNMSSLDSSIDVTKLEVAIHDRSLGAVVIDQSTPKRILNQLCKLSFAYNAHFSHIVWQWPNKWKANEILPSLSETKTSNKQDDLGICFFFPMYLWFIWRKLFGLVWQNPVPDLAMLLVICFPGKRWRASPHWWVSIVELKQFVSD